MANFEIEVLNKASLNLLFENSFNLLNVPGVYIYGVKILIDKELKFIPLYVGIHKNLNTRLKEHYKKNSSNGNGLKELFDLSAIKSLKDVEKLYKDTQIYNSLNKLHQDRISLESLIWFNHPTFFDKKCNSVVKSAYKSNSGQLNSIIVGGDLDKMNTAEALKLKSKILKTKDIFTESFYCAYLTLDSIVQEIRKDKKHPLFDLAEEYYINTDYTIGRKNAAGKKLCELIENSLKKSLATLGIYTTAKSTKKIIPNSDSFDISSIHKDLINLTGKPLPKNIKIE
jgi:hypothetical protein